MSLTVAQAAPSERQPELLEQAGHDPRLVDGSLDDLARLNRWLGGTALSLRGLARLTRRLPVGSRVTILDVGPGGGDIAAAMAGWARRRGLAVRLIGVDLSPTIARAARRRQPELALVVADGQCLPLSDGSVDVATCSLLLHHLPPDGVVQLLSELRRVARRGAIINDLTRGPVGVAGAWLLSRTLTHNPLTRHDAPLSARQAYSRAELVALARAAGLGPLHQASAFGYRVSLTAEWGG